MSAGLPVRTILQVTVLLDQTAHAASKSCSFLLSLLLTYFSSPKPDIPTPKAYDPPSPPSPKDLGPPPPGYGRYADFDRSGAMSAAPSAQGGFAGGPRRNLDDVLCFKV